MATHFASDTFENDYILQCLGHMLEEIKTKRDHGQIMDKYAVELTAFMNGQIVQAVKRALPEGENTGTESAATS